MVCNRFSTLTAIVITIAVVTSGCGFTQSAPVADSGAVTVSLSDATAKPGGGLSALESATIQSISLEISASDMDTINTTISSDTLETSVDVPSGENRTFTAIVTIAGQPFTGSTVENIEAGSSTTVEIDITIDGTAYAIYTVGGTVSGASGSLTLQLNGANNLLVSSNGSFAFSTTYFMTTDAYSVTISSHPSGQLCSLSNNSGNMPASNVTNVSVSCADTSLPSPSAIVGGGDYTVLAKSDGTVWGWGSNWQGQLGDGTTTSSSTPVQVCASGESAPCGNFIASVDGVAAGWSHSLALKTGGAVWTWGSNWNGELGDGTTTSSSIPVQVCDAGETDPCNTYLTNVTIISAAYEGSLAVKSDGTVWTWGRNGNGQLGDGTTTDSSVPVQVCDAGETDPCSTYLTNVIDAVAGGYYVLALKSDGTVWGWGSNWNGQLGDGTTTQRLTPVQVTDPSDASGFLTSVVAVAAGDSHSVALKSDGTVWAWGDNNAGRLGDGTSIDSYTPVQVCAADEIDPCSNFLTGITAIAASGNEAEHNLAIKSDGTLWTWGGNWRGQLGDGTTTDRSVPVQVCAALETAPCSSFLTGVTAITAGYDHSIAVKSGGTIWGWGSNGSGELGDGTTTDSEVPVQVIGLVTYTVGGSVSGMSGGTLVLQNNSGDDLNISADGSFTFATEIASGSTYSVTKLTDPTGQTCTVTSGSGTISSNVTNVTVTCVTSSSKSWTHPSSITDYISPDGESAYNSQVAMDDNGNSIIVWDQRDGTNYQIFKSEYRSGSWNHPSSLTDNISLDGMSAYNPQVAMDNNGNAIIVWYQYDGTYWQIFKSEYRSGSWTHPSSLTDNISPDGQSAYYPHVAMDDSGNAIIVWEQLDGTTNCTGSSSCYQTFKSEYRSGTWTHPSSLTDNISPDGQSAWGPHVAIDNSGNAIIVWYQYDGTTNCSGSNCRNIYMSEYRSGSWTHPSSLSDYINIGGTLALNPLPTMDNNGNAIIVWSQTDGTYNQIFKSEYRSGSWVHPSSLVDNISPDGQHAYDQHLAMDNNGNAIIVWRQSDGTYYRIFKSEYRSGSWVHPSIVDGISPTGSSVYYPTEVAMSDNGEAVIVWNQDAGTYDEVFKSEYRSGSWVHPSSLTDNISPDEWAEGDTTVAMDSSGNTVIVWDEYGTGNDQIYMSNYR